MAGPATRSSGAAVQLRTHCRICEPQCGLLATVADGRIVKVEGNRDHVLSRGHLCVKAAAAADVIYDEDRVVTPLKRTGGPGEFTPTSWEQALADIAARLAHLRSRYGAASFATFVGNPTFFGYAASFWLGGFQAALDVKWRYGVNSEDAAARIVASKLLYGSVATWLKPDLWRSRFLLMVGANPFVSHSSLYCEPHVRDALHGIVARGGRVVVVDPRRSETARHFEHIAVRPGTDAHFLIAIVRTIFDEQLHDQAFVDRFTSGAERLRQLLQAFDVDRCAEACGVSPLTLRQLARDFAAANGGVVYGRTGTCTQRFGTLVNLLLDTINVLTGNIERPGGHVFGWSPVDFGKLAESGGNATYAKHRTRVNGHPDVFGLHPSTSLVPDIVTPGPERVRALMTIGANPVLSSAGGGEPLEHALQQLDLHFSLDLYITETNKYADYILPVPTFYERSDVPFLAIGAMLRPSIWYSPAIVEPRGDVREEWKILQEVARRVGLGGAYASRWMRWLARIGVEITPEQLADMLIRTGPAGDRFGLRRNGLNLRKIRQEHPDGLMLKSELPIGDLRARLRTPDRRINLCCEVLAPELDRLARHADDPQFPLRLIGMREMRSQNTWLHNVKRVMPDRRRHRAHIHPEDATHYAVRDGERIVIRSKAGEIEVPVTVTADVVRGTIALPHGWGHSGGWRLANSNAGVNSNVLASADPADIEPIAGMSILSGIPVQIAPTVSPPQQASPD